MTRKVAFASQPTAVQNGGAGGGTTYSTPTKHDASTAAAATSDRSCESLASTISSYSTSSSSSAAKSAVLRSQLMRTHKHRNPEMFYDVIQVLGKGSMGEVAKVCKKPSMVGGSAYRDLSNFYEYDHHTSTNEYADDTNDNDKNNTSDCFQSFLRGGFFAYCLKGSATTANTDQAKSLQSSPTMTMAGGKDLSTKDTCTSTSMSTISTSPSSFAYAQEEEEEEPPCTSSERSETSVRLAMKSIHLDLLTKKVMIEELENEVEILKSLDHPYIVRVMETFDYKKQLFVIMELCEGGDLYSRDPYTEEEAARICRMVLSAISYMHAHGVIHRDLKFENILFVHDRLDSDHIKLIDFGLSTIIKESDVLTEGTGTIYTMAPEVLRGNYSKQADLWSVGVIAFMLLSSQMAFYGKTRKAVIKRILSGAYGFSGRRWKKISDQAKDFVDSLLVIDPSQRATAEQALNSTWLHLQTNTVGPQDGELEAVRQSIIRYTSFPRLRRVALMVLAHRSTSDEIGILRKVFEHYDKSKEGNLTYEEFKAAVYNPMYLEEDYRDLFDAVDVDGSGRIRYTEFLAATMDAAGWISEERIAEVFDRLDQDDTGFISRENLKSLLGSDYPEWAVDLIMKEAGSENDKGIRYANFRSQWRYDNVGFESQLKGLIGDLAHSTRGESMRAEVASDVNELEFEAEPDEPELADALSNYREGKSYSIRKKSSSSLIKPCPDIVESDASQ